MRGRLDIREIDDISDTALSYAEVKALATGDERILEQAKLETEIARLDRLQRSHHRNQTALAATLDAAERDLPELQADLDQLAASIAVRTETRGEAFLMTVAGRQHTERPAAADALADQLRAIPRYTSRTIGRLAGFDLRADAFETGYYSVSLQDVPRCSVSIEPKDLAGGTPLGLIARVENRAAGIETLHAELAERIRRTSTERDRAAAQLGKPFPHADALAAARARAVQLAEELYASTEQNIPTAAASSGQDRWAATAERIHPHLAQSASWTPLQAALDRAAAAGVDVDEVLTRLVEQQPPGGADPAGDLLWRLYQHCPEAAPSIEHLPADPGAAGSAGRDAGGLTRLIAAPVQPPPASQHSPAAGISI